MSSESEKENKINVVNLPVIGMTCANCAATIERTLTKRVSGVTSATVNLATETATVKYDPSIVTLETLAEAVDRAGYTLVLPRDGDSGDDEDQNLGEYTVGKIVDYILEKYKPQ